MKVGLICEPPHSRLVCNNCSYGGCRGTTTAILRINQLITFHRSNLQDGKASLVLTYQLSVVRPGSGGRRESKLGGVPSRECRVGSGVVRYKERYRPGAHQGVSHRARQRHRQPPTTGQSDGRVVGWWSIRRGTNVGVRPRTAQKARWKAGSGSY